MPLDGTSSQNDINLYVNVSLVQAKTKARDAGLSIDFITHDIETASFPDRSFDCILCSNGMAYLQHPQATLRNFLAWLATGGMLCFNNPQASACSLFLERCCPLHVILRFSTCFPASLRGCMQQKVHAAFL